MATSRSKTSSAATGFGAEQTDRPNGAQKTGNGSVANAANGVIGEVSLPAQMP